MNNPHLRDLAEGVNKIPDDHEIITTGKKFKATIIGILEFSDSLLDNQKRLMEFLQGIKDMKAVNNNEQTKTR